MIRAVVGPKEAGILRALLRKLAQSNPIQRLATSNAISLLLSWMWLMRIACCQLCSLGVVSILLSSAAFAETDFQSRPLAISQPLSVQEKFEYYLQNTYSIRDVLERSALAGIAQWRDNPREWEQGLSGYGRRLSSNFGQYSIKKSLQFGIGAALKEDPRYFASTERGFWRRTTHAVTHTVMVRNDDNRRVFSFGRVGGTLGGSFVSRTWQPQREQTVGHALRNAGFSLGTEAGWNMLREFWPDIKKRFRKGK